MSARRTNILSDRFLRVRPVFGEPLIERTVLHVQKTQGVFWGGLEHMEEGEYKPLRTIGGVAWRKGNTWYYFPEYVLN
jgi:hypothetical protein